MSRDARFVLAVLAHTPIPISEIDVRLVHDLVDGPPKHTEQVLDDLLAAGEITDAGAGLWALTGIPAVDVTAMAGRRARRGHDPVEVLLAWLVELVVEADREVSPYSWRLSVPGPDRRPFGGRRGTIEWWELHRAQLLRLVDRALWPLARRLAAALSTQARAVRAAGAVSDRPRRNPTR